MFLRGGGENGKSTVVFAVKAAFGNYAVLLPETVLSQDYAKQHDTVLTDLRGARAAFVEELPEEKRLAMQRIKAMTAPQMTAHKMRKDYVTWDTTHALIVSTNPRPLVPETDHGTWRRLNMLDWPYHFWKAYEFPADPDEYDRKAVSGLRERMKAGRDGRAEAVLAWLVSGAVDSFALDDDEMPAPTKRVLHDTDVWRKSADPLLRFADEWLEAHPTSHVMCNDVTGALNDFLTGEGHPQWSGQTITNRMQDAFPKVVKKSTKSAGKGGTNLSPLLAFVAPPKVYWAWHGLRWKVPSSTGEPDSVAEVADLFIERP